MRHRRRLGVATCAALALLCAPAAGAAAPPVRMSASFDRDAVLGGTTALEVSLQLDRDLSLSPLTEVRFEYPRSLGVVSSGLGLAACSRPASDFAQVLISGPRLGGCPPNAVMGYGTARAVVRLTDGQSIPEYATVSLLSGPLEQGRLGLVVYVDGQHPFGAKLAFAGEVRGAPAPYGGVLAVRMPTIPGIEDLAVISLAELRLTLGSHAIRYRERRGGQLRSYRPGGVVLPARCPRGGFPFRAGVTFADGSSAAAAIRTPCPPSPVAPASGSR